MSAAAPELIDDHDSGTKNSIRYRTIANSFLWHRHAWVGHRPSCILLSSFDAAARPKIPRSYLRFSCWSVRAKPIQYQRLRLLGLARSLLQRSAACARSAVLSHCCSNLRHCSSYFLKSFPVESRQSSTERGRLRLRRPKFTGRNHPTSTQRPDAVAYRKTCKREVLIRGCD
jgi:hypothetical protein